MSAGTRTAAAIEELRVDVATLPTERPESDGTLAWNETTIVLVRARASGRTGVGWSYAHPCAAGLVRDPLRALVEGSDALDVPRTWERMRRALRNAGAVGPGAHALSAVDTALWDLKARLLDLPLADLWGRARDSVEVYGSGGFTSYTLEELCDELGAWARAGVKLKIGLGREEDLRRVAAARAAVGEGVRLFVDANGAYGVPEAAALMPGLGELGVTWLEEPVSSDDLRGLCALRRRASPGMAIAAGEYGYRPPYFRRMLAAGAVDVLQADATRCGGFTGFLTVAGLCEAAGRPLSAHCAPSLHRHVGLAAPRVVHLEWFHDHVRLERLLFEGFGEPEAGRLGVDGARAGNGLTVDEDRLARWQAAS